jgi:hypothetical protein
MAVMGLSGCPATDAEKDAALQAYVTCLKRAARQLDDGKSDAATVALAIQSRCAVEFDYSLDVFGQGMPLDAQVNFRQQSRERQLEISTQVVLTERAAR